MANLKSSKKRIRSNAKREIRNTSVKTAVKTAIKKVEQSIDEGNLETARVNYSRAVSALDSASTRGVIKKNTASRMKSKLARGINAIQSAA